MPEPGWHGHSDIDERALKQLDLLRQIDLTLAELDAPFWLRGGWGVDFLLGRITRPHADLDLVAWQRDRDRLHRALGAARFVMERELPGQVDYVNDGHDITFVYLDQHLDGSIAAHGIAGWEWSQDALPVDLHCLGGVCLRVVSVEQMLNDFDGYERATGRPLREKDHQTIALLRQLLKRS